MKKINRLWGVLVLVVFVTGCPDGPPQILRDKRNTACEVADYLSKVKDDDSAKNAIAIANKLKDRWETIKKRRENFLKLAGKAETKEFGKLQNEKEYKREMEASIERLKQYAGSVRNKITDPALASEISQFESKVFGGALQIPTDPTPPEKKN